jgi:GNAT superfamily N-acetyltransferase
MMGNGSGRVAIMPESPVPGSVVARATEHDAAELCVLQRCCWVAEAIANDTLAIPALHEDLATITQWIKEMQVWTVRVDGRLIGAVRGALSDDSWQVGRLMVAPDFAGQGLGRWLLTFIEGRAPAHVRSYELFTGARSERNLRMYNRAGYAVSTADEPTPPGHIEIAIFLTKQRVSDPIIRLQPGT